MKLLIVEDSGPVRNLLEALFKRGYELTVCSSFSEALISLQEEEKPDIIISDNDLPEFDQGLRLWEHVQQEGLKCRFIMHSGGNQIRLCARALNEGFFFVPKRCNVTALLKAVKTATNLSNN